MFLFSTTKKVPVVRGKFNKSENLYTYVQQEEVKTLAFQIGADWPAQNNNITLYSVHEPRPQHGADWPAQDD